MEVRTVEPFLDYYRRIRQRTNRLLELVPEEKLEWTYRPGKYSIGDIIRHLAGMERYMYAEIAAGRTNAYPGCGKELATGLENVLQYFHQLHEESLRIFNGMTDEALLQKCTSPAGVQLTVGKWLRAMVEHEIHHRGQLYICLNMLEVSTPPIFGMTAEEVAACSNLQKTSL